MIIISGHPAIACAYEGRLGGSSLLVGLFIELGSEANSFIEQRAVFVLQMQHAV